MSDRILDVSINAMTMRDHVAMKMAEVAWPICRQQSIPGVSSATLTAHVAYEVADALLAERAKKSQVTDGY
jgi:hypothetical protein